MTEQEYRDLARLARKAAVEESEEGNEGNEMLLNNVSAWASRRGGE